MELDPRHLPSLVSLLNDQITELDDRIVTLTASAKKLVSPETYEELSKEKPALEAQELDEESLIEELEKNRIQLVASLQQQDFIRGKLQEMIADSQLLVSTVVDQCEARKSETENEEAAFEERCAGYRSSIEDLTINDLKDNVENSSRVLDYLQTESLRKLQGISTAQGTLESEAYKKLLNETINVLNTTFEKLVKT